MFSITFEGTFHPSKRIAKVQLFFQLAKSCQSFKP